METRIKTQYGTVHYDRTTNFNLQEGAFLSNAIREAFEILNVSIYRLKKGEVKNGTINAIFKNGGDIAAILSSIAKNFKDGGIKCRRDKSYSDENGGGDSSVLASVSDDGEIRIFDSFFDRKAVKDNRAGVIIHEVAHLVGLKDEENFNSDSDEITSAESVKNFCLCVVGILSPDEIIREPEQPSNSDEPTYRTNPNRKGNGQFDFGPDSGKRGQSADSEAGKSADKNRMAKDGNDIVKPIKDAQSLSAQNGIAFEAENITTAFSDKDLSEEKLVFKHGGFGNSEIKDGPDPEDKIKNPDKKYAWGAIEAKLNGLRKNTKYTVVQEHEFRSTYMDDDAPETKRIAVAHEITSNADGEARLKRVGVVHMPLKHEDGRYLGKVEIDIDLKLVEGSIDRHFKKVEKLDSYTNSVEYIIRHATLNDGGKVDTGLAGKLAGKPLFSGRFAKRIL